MFRKRTKVDAKRLLTLGKRARASGKGEMPELPLPPQYPTFNIVTEIDENILFAKCWTCDKTCLMAIVWLDIQVD
jgi:hypothetical protein